MQHVPFDSQSKISLIDKFFFIRKVFSISNEITTNFDRALKIYKRLIPLTLPNVDSEGNTIQLWKAEKYGLIGSVTDRFGKVQIIRSQKIINPLSKDIQKDVLANRLENCVLKRWSIVFNPLKMELIIWPHLIAAAKHGTPGEVDEIYVKKLDSKTLSAAIREESGEVVKYKNTGIPYNHQKEVKDYTKGLDRHIAALKNNLNLSNLSENQRKPLEAELKKAEELLTNVNKTMGSLNPKAYRKGVNVIAHSDQKSWAIFHKHEKLFQRFKPPGSGPDGGGSSKKGGGGPPRNPSVRQGTYRETKPLSLLGRLLQPGRQMKEIDFKMRLQLNKLTDSYNSCNPKTPVPKGGGSGGSIGGVGNQVGIILGLFDSLSAQLENQHTFFLPGSDLSLSEEEVNRILYELAVGIFVHDTVPFFSLHFNGDTNMYPIIHPAYQDTFIGYVISMLDYYMKGFLNGGFFDADFVEKWNSGLEYRNEDALKANVIDLEAYCKTHLGEEKNYLSIKEFLRHFEKEEHPDPFQNPLFRDYSGFRSSFRIIAKQNNIKKTESLFFINGAFDVLYTIIPDPIYAEALAKYKQLTGHYPPSYIRLEKAYQAMSEQIKELLPRLPHCKKLFEALNLINFFCYYYNTLKEKGKFPLIEPGIFEAKRCPPLFPHLPLRTHYKEEIKVPLRMLFSKISEEQREIIFNYMKDRSSRERNKAAAITHFAEAIRNCICQVARYPLSKEQKDSSNYKDFAQTRLEKLTGSYNDIKGGIITYNNNEIKKLERLQIPPEGRLSLLSILQGRLDKILSDPLYALEHNLKDSSFPMNMDSNVFHLYSEQREEEERHLQKRVVGGCGVQLERKPLEIDPISYHLLNQFPDHVASLQEGEVLPITEKIPGILFTLKFADLPLFDEEERQVATRYLCPIAIPIGEESEQEQVQKIANARAELFQAMALGEDTAEKVKEKEEIFQKAAEQIEDWNFKDGFGVSPLHYAASSGNQFIFDFLIQKVDLTLRDTQGYTALHYAAEAGNTKTVETLLVKAPQLLNSQAFGGASPLYIAVQNNQLAITSLLLRKNADLNLQTAQGMNVLLCAIHRKHLDIALELLKYSINLEQCLDDKTNALHLAVELGLTTIVKRLIEKGIDVNRTRWDGHAAIHLAAKQNNLPLFTALLTAKDINVNLQLKSGKTALHIAAMYDRYEIVEALLLKKADLTLVGWDNETILMTAIRNGSINSFACLWHFAKKLKQADFSSLVNGKDIQGETALDIAMDLRIYDIWFTLFNPINDDQKKTHLTPMKHLLRLCDRNIDPSLIYQFMNTHKLTEPHQIKAALRALSLAGHAAGVSFLRWKFPHINDFAEKGQWGIYHYAAKFDDLFLFQELLGTNFSRTDIKELEEWTLIAARHGSLRVLEFLSETLFCQERLEAVKKELLLQAIEGGNDLAVEVLIKKIFPINFALDNKGRSLGHIAVFQGDRKMVKRLFAFGAEFDLVDNQGRTPFHYAIDYNREKILTELLNRAKTLPPDLLHFAAEKGTPKTLNSVLKWGTGLNAPHPSTGETPLMTAIRADNVACAKALISQGADLLVKNRQGETAFLLAVQYSKKTMQFLLQYNLPLQKNQEGQTALHLAVMQGEDEIVEILLQHGFDSLSLDNAGKTPIAYAKEKKFSDVSRLLQGKGKILEEEKRKIISALLEGSTTDFFNLIEQFPLNKPMLFSLPKEGRERLPLLHLIDVLQLTDETKREFFNKFANLDNVDLRVKNSEGETLLHRAGRQDKEFDLKGFKLKEADLRSPGDLGATPIHLFAMSASLERFKSILLPIEQQKEKFSSKEPVYNKAFLEIENYQGYTPLFPAILRNRKEIVTFLLDQGVNPNHYTKDLMTPLGLAILENFLPLVQILVDKGADIEAPIGINGDGPLHLAVRMGFEEIARWLLGKVNRTQKNRKGEEAIHIAAAKGDENMLRLLHECRNTPGIALDKKNNTAAYFAAGSSSLEAMNFLIERKYPLEPLTGKEFEEKQVSSIAPLHFAAQRGDVEMVSHLMQQKVNIDIPDKKETTVLRHATLSGNPEMLNIFINTPLIEDRKQVRRAIFTAIQRDDVEQLCALLTHFALDINEQIEEIDLTLLQCASMWGAANIAQYLLKQGANPLVGEKTPPFALAVLHNHTEIASLLASEPKVNVNQRMEDGRTYLHIAAEEDNLSLIALLFSKEAQFEAYDYQGHTPLQRALFKGRRRAIRMLLCLGAKSTTTTRSGKKARTVIEDPEIDALFASYEETLTICHNNAESKIHAAIRLGDLDAFLVLSQAEGIEQRGKDGRTPLHLATTQKNFPILRQILDYSSNLEVADRQGKTPLFIAATEVKDLELVRFFLQLGANPLVELKDKTSLLHAIVKQESTQPLCAIFKEIYQAIPKADLNDDVHRDLYSDNVEIFFQALQSGASLEPHIVPILRNAIAKQNKEPLCALFKEICQTIPIDLNLHLSDVKIFFQTLQKRALLDPHIISSLQNAIAQQESTKLLCAILKEIYRAIPKADPNDHIHLDLYSRDVKVFFQALQQGASLEPRFVSVLQNAMRLENPILEFLFSWSTVLDKENSAVSAVDPKSDRFFTK